MSDVDGWLRMTEARSTLISEAYRLQLSRLWWANLVFVVFPAVLSTAAAVFAFPDTTVKIPGLELPLASAFAGGAAILISIHKALKCDEYQAECQRLGQLHQSVAVSASLARSRPESERHSHQERIARKLEEITESSAARLGTRIIRKAEKRTGTKLLRQSGEEQQL